MVSSAVPRITVVLPTHNRARLLDRSVQSVLAQTHRDLELIVVNDGSTDDTREVLARYDDPRLRVIHRDTGGGASAARNAGIAAARGAFVAFMDDDDFWLVRKLERQLAALRSAQAPLAWCVAGYIRLDRPVEYIGGPALHAALDPRRGQNKEWPLIATPGWLVPRELFELAGTFDERIRSWDDWELALRLIAAGGRPLLVDEPLWVQDWLRGGGLVRAERARARDLRIVMQKHGQIWDDLPAVQATHWYIIGRAESLYDPAPAGRDALLRSLRLRPSRIRTWAALLVSFLGQRQVAWLTRLARRLQGAA